MLCNYHDDGEGAWLQDDGKNFSTSGAGSNKCRKCVSVHSARIGAPTEERQPHLIELLDSLLEVLDDDEAEVLESKLDFVNFKKSELRAEAKALGAFPAGFGPQASTHSG